MPLTTQVTYSDPKVTRTETSASIEFDIYTPAFPTSWDEIRLYVEGESLLVSDRSTDAGLSGTVQIPAPVLPAFLAEAQRLLAVIS